MYKVDYEKQGKDASIMCESKQSLLNTIEHISNGDMHSLLEIKQWCETATNGRKFVNQRYRFTIEYKEGIKTRKTTVMKNEEIVKLMLIKDGKEKYARIYDDGCWWVDIEKHPYGMIRFWVGYEDKRTGKSNASLCTVCNYGDKWDCATDFKIKDVIKNKVISVSNAISKAANKGV